MIIPLMSPPSVALGEPRSLDRATLTSREAEGRKIYEARVVADSLARLAKRFDRATLPFSDEELQTLAKRARESFQAFGNEAKKERLGRYKAHLSTLYGEASVGPAWSALEEINNEIGYEEK